METEKIIEEQLKKLSIEISSLFFDQEIPRKILDVSKLFNINEDQAKKLETETYLLILGLTDPAEFSEEIEVQLGLDGNTAERISDEIEKIITPRIIEELAEFYEKEKQEPNIDDNKHGISISYDPRFSELSQNIQDAIASSGWREKLYKISQDHKLNIEQMGIVEDITTKMITGNIHSDQYESALNEKLGITSEEVGKIVNEVNENILKSIREGEKIITNDQPARPVGELLINNGNANASSKEQVVGSKEEEIPLPPYVNTSSKEQVVGSKENANAENKPINPLEEKMTKPVSNTQTTSNYSSPKASASDPYREVI